MPFVKASSGVQVHYMVPSCLDHTDTIDLDKPTIILLHQRLVDLYLLSFNYRDTRLARGYNLIAIDHHWHGRTQPPVDDKPYDFKLVAQDLLSAMTALRVPNAHIFGFCLGTQIGVTMKTLAPDRILSLVLCGLLPEEETQENLEQYRFLRDSYFEKADDGSDQVPSDVAAGIHWLTCGDWPDANYLLDEWAVSTVFKPSNRKLITKVFSASLDRKPINSKLWAAIQCPVLIVHGAEDAVCTEEAARSIYDMMPRAQREIQIVPEAPHFVGLTHALVVNKIVADFYDRITGVDSRAAAARPVIRPTRAPPSFLEEPQASALQKPSILKRMFS